MPIFTMTQLIQIKLVLVFFFFLFNCVFIHGQASTDSILSRLSYEFDFRFRVEHDWSSRKSDGSYREDRTRLRYRFRAGAQYEKDWYTIGFRVRTGTQRKQQDPQLTLGKGLQEFGTVPIGFEKIYFQGDLDLWKFWLGKNTFPFRKMNELFWSDNVYPEGVFIKKTFTLKSTVLDKIELSGGHFILNSNDGTLLDDGYLQGLQSHLTLLNKRIEIFPSLYLFRNIRDIPDGEHRALLDYSIVHLGARIQPMKTQPLYIEADFYQNVEDYAQEATIDTAFQDQGIGLVFGIQYGSIRERGDWMFKASYARLEKYSILDYMAQNDWARWDYSSYNSPDGRLSNLEGVEMVVAYALRKNIKLVTKMYFVEDLITRGAFHETGSRIRFDIDVRI